MLLTLLFIDNEVNEVCLMPSNITYQTANSWSNSILEHHFLKMMDHTIFNSTAGIFSEDITEIATFVGVLMLSFILSTIIVSNYIYTIMVNDFVKIYDSNKSLYNYDSYFYTFLDEYDLLEKNELDNNYLKSLNYKYIKETTPCGEIILNYNNENNSFDYYCKKSNTISFNYLDVVSRIYVVNFDCKKIYNDNYENLVLYYNIKYGITTNNDTLETFVENSSPVFFTRKTPASKNKDMYNFISNKYKYKGAIEDFYDYCKTNGLTISFNKDVSHNSLQDLSLCFFYLDSINDINDVNNVNTISFKTFKTNTIDKKIVSL